MPGKSPRQPSWHDIVGCRGSCSTREAHNNNDAVEKEPKSHFGFAYFAQQQKRVRSCRGRHEHVVLLNFRYIRRLAILAKESRWCLGLMQSPSEMEWKRQLPRAGPGVPVGLVTFGFFCCFWRRFEVGFGGEVAAPENEEALDSAFMCVMRGRRNAYKYRNCLLVYRRYAVKKPGSCCRSTGKPLTDLRIISKYL